MLETRSTSHRSDAGREGRRRSARLAPWGARAWLLAVCCLSGAVLAACSSSPTTIDPAQARSAIEHDYSTLFNFANSSVEDKLAVIQDGATLRTALSQALSSTLAKSASGAKVSAVQLLTGSTCSDATLPSPCAKVTYTLLGPTGTPLFATGSTGYAVYVGGRWLVAKPTICGLLELFYSTAGHQGTPPGC